jgi:hypothetical protein
MGCLLALVVPAHQPQHSPVATEVQVQPLNIKPGLWETTMTIRTAGQLPMAAELLNKLTPEQRAEFEARMQARSALGERDG